MEAGKIIRVYHVREDIARILSKIKNGDTKICRAYRDRFQHEAISGGEMRSINLCLDYIANSN